MYAILVFVPNLQEALGERFLSGELPYGALFFGGSFGLLACLLYGFTPSEAREDGGEDLQVVIFTDWGGGRCGLAKVKNAEVKVKHALR